MDILFRLVGLLGALSAALLLAGCQPGAAPPSSAAIDPNKYYAVLLNNNTVYFGKLEGLRVGLSCAPRGFLCADECRCGN